MFPAPRKRSRKKGRRNKTNAAAYIITASIVFVILLTVLIIILTGNGSVLKAIPQIVADTDIKASTQDNIYFERDGKLYCTDYAGNQKWSADLQSPDMNLFASGDNVIAYNAVLMQVFGSSGQHISNTQFHGTVKRVSCSDQMIAALVEDTTGTTRIVLLDRKGAEITKLNYEDQYIVDFGFFSQGSIFVQTLATDTLSPKSMIMTYSNTLNNTGNIRIDFELIQHLEFQESEMIAVCTNHILTLDYVGSKKDEKLIYGWKYKDSYITSGKSVFLFTQGGETTSEGLIHTARICELGKADVYLQLPAGTIDISLGKDKIYAFTDSLVRVYNLSGSIISEHTFPYTAEKLTLMSNKQYILIYTGTDTIAIKLP